MLDTKHPINDSNGTNLAQPDQMAERFERLERTLTAHGHLLDTRQPGMPVTGIHRKLALPIPLASYSIGVTSWIMGVLLLKVRMR